MPMSTQNETVEVARLAVDSAAIGTNAAKATVAGAATLVYGGYTINDVAMAVGAFVAVIGLIVQIVSQAHSARVREREDSRNDEMHKLRMQMLRSSSGESPETWDSQRGDV